MNAIQAEIQKTVISRLALHSILSKDGAKGPNCQTGEPYTELVIRASSFSDLVTAIVGAVAAFGERDCTCYWRIKPDLEDDLMDGCRCYMRFCVTNKPEMAQAA